MCGPCVPIGVIRSFMSVPMCVTFVFTLRTPVCATWCPYCERLVLGFFYVDSNGVSFVFPLRTPM